MFDWKLSLTFVYSRCEQPCLFVCTWVPGCLFAGNRAGRRVRPENATNTQWTHRIKACRNVIWWFHCRHVFVDMSSTWLFSGVFIAKLYGAFQSGRYIYFLNLLIYEWSRCIRIRDSGFCSVSLWGCCQALHPRMVHCSHAARANPWSSFPLDFFLLRCVGMLRLFHNWLQTTGFDAFGVSRPVPSDVFNGNVFGHRPHLIGRLGTRDSNSTPALWPAASFCCIASIIHAWRSMTRPIRYLPSHDVIAMRYACMVCGHCSHCCCRACFSRKLCSCGVDSVIMEVYDGVRNLWFSVISKPYRLRSLVFRVCMDACVHVADNPIGLFLLRFRCSVNITRTVNIYPTISIQHAGTCGNHSGS